MEELIVIGASIEVGKFKLVIDRRSPLEWIIAAYHYMDTDRKKGHVHIALEKSYERIRTAAKRAVPTLRTFHPPADNAEIGLHLLKW